MNRTVFDLLTGGSVLLVLLGPALIAGIARAEEAPPAMADSAESMILVRTLTGPKARDVQPVVEGAIAENYSVVSASKEEDKELQGGASALVSMSREKKYRGYVEGEVKQTPNGFSVTLTVFSGEDGMPKGDATFEAKSVDALVEKVDKTAAKTLAKALAATQVAKAGEEKLKIKIDLDEEDASDEEEEEPEDDDERPSPLDVSAAVGFVDMSLTYNEPVQDAFGFQLQSRPSTPLAFRVGGHWYPGAHVTASALADIGLAASFYQTLGGTIGVNGTPFDLEFTELNIGLKGRARFSGAELGLNLGMGMSAANVLGDNELFINNPVETDPGLFPDMNYTYFRFGVDGRVRVVDGVSIDGGLFVRLPSLGDEPGQAKETLWFPRASADGLELQLSALYALPLGLSAQLGVDMRTYGLQLNSTEEDVGVRAIAGGAEDRYLGLFAGLEWKL